MSIEFHEINGSPLEIYTTDGFTAQRQFLVRWNERSQFAQWLMGTSNDYGSRDSVSYPNRADVRPYKLKIEPFNPDTILKQTISQPSDFVNKYASFALVTVSYKTLTQQDLDDGPTPEPGTRLTYRMDWYSEPVSLYPTGTFWQNNSTSLNIGMEVIHTLPQTVHILTWQQVVNPPWTAIRTLQGKVNTGVFLDCPAETLLFMGVKANKLFRGDLEEGESAFCWSLEYQFRQKIISQGENVFGWNSMFQPTTGTWQNLRLGIPPATGNPLYEAGDFSRLFISEFQ